MTVSPSLSRLLPVCLAVAALGPPAVRAAGRGEPGPVFPVEIRLADRRADLATLLGLDIDVDAVTFDRARAYVIASEVETLKSLGFDLERIPDDAPAAARAAAAGPVPEWTGESIPAAYHTYATLTTELHAIADARPDLTRLYSIGASGQGRQLWIMKISRNPDLEEDEPEVAYIAAMHGDEVVGKELCVGLIHHLLDNYGTDPRVTALVDGAEIWILPSMNPDGTEAGTRYNAAGEDLNRSFPDEFDDPVNTPTGRPVEVGLVMAWQASHSTVLSANFHGGALVANYPRDGNAAGTNVYAASPDDPLMISLARTYADGNPQMLANNSDASYVAGICNGADWYTVRGGMQDWNYVWNANIQNTVEQGNTKWPAASALPQYWSDNLESLLSYFERATEGIRGVVTDKVSGAPLAATVKVLGYTLLGAPMTVRTDPDAGDFHRMLLPGTYSLEIASPGHVTAVLNDVVVSAGSPATRRDVELLPAGQNLQYYSRIVQDSGGNGVLDPGETATLALTLKNYGSSANGIGPARRVEPVGHDHASDGLVREHRRQPHRNLPVAALRRVGVAVDPGRPQDRLPRRVELHRQLRDDRGVLHARGRPNVHHGRVHERPARDRGPRHGDEHRGRLLHARDGRGERLREPHPSEHRRPDDHRRLAVREAGRPPRPVGDHGQPLRLVRHGQGVVRAARAVRRRDAERDVDAARVRRRPREHGLARGLVGAGLRPAVRGDAPRDDPPGRDQERSERRRRVVPVPGSHRLQGVPHRDAVGGRVVRRRDVLGR